MAKMKYCQYCDRVVKPKKSINWLFVLLTFWFAVGIIYLIVYMFKKKECPICGGNTISIKKVKKAKENKEVE